MLTTSGHRLLKDGRPCKLWGLRTASGVNSDEDNDALIAALDDYAGFGVNALTVFLQGSSGGYCQAFSPDGTAVDRNIRRRLERLLDETERRGFVLIVGLFYQRSGRLESAEAYVRAAETAAGLLRERRHVIVNAVNENNSRLWTGSPYPMGDAEAVGRLCRVVKLAAPQLPVGGGGYDPETNLLLARDARLDVLLYDDIEFPSTLPRYLAQGLAMPHINVETIGSASGGWAALPGGEQVRGVWPEKRVGRTCGKEDFYGYIRAAAEHDGVHLFGHLQAWFQGKEQGLPANRYDVGGCGTLDEPGIRWYLEAVRRAAEGGSA